MLKTVSLAMTSQTYNHDASRVAAVLTKLLAGRLMAYYVRPDPCATLPFMSEGLTADTIQTLSDTADRDGRKGAADAEAFFQSLAEEHGLSFNCDAQFNTLIGTVADHVGRKARISDIAVSPQPTSDLPDATDMLHDLLFKSGRLMLMVPDGAQSVGRHILIGWNGRAECARAIGAALPLLGYAEKVTALQVGDIGDERPAMDELEDYLSTFQLNLECHRIADGSGGIAEQIHAHARDIGADTLMIGAYSHARWREMILGGATQWLVNNSKLPVLMSH